MLFSKLLILAATATAFTIPEGQPEGVYEVSYNADGTESHTLLHEPYVAVRRGRGLGHAGVTERDIPGGSNSVSCGGNLLDQGDTDAANGDLDNQCGNGAVVGGDRDYYSIRGCTVAYFCNFSGDSDECSAWERGQASLSVTGNCGRYWSGWDTFVNSDRDISYGYEYYCGWPGSHFCNRGP